MSQNIHLFAAGSLKDAMREIIGEFHAASGVTVVATFGAAGGLRARIEKGETCCVFASANIEHPAKLKEIGRAENVFRFAGNSMCAVLKPGLQMSSEEIGQLMAKPDVIIGTSTPGNDPSGDYAMRVLAKANIASDDKRVVAVTGGREQKIARRDGYGDYAGAFIDARVDMLLIYESAATKLVRELPGSTKVCLPDALKVTADYGIALLKPHSMHAADFVEFVRHDGQGALARCGLRLQ